VPTTQISLIREHTEIIKPPRALWVPFEFGRPLGAPGNAIFQRQVLFTALRLLETSDVPVLEDFPQDAPLSKEAGTLRAFPVNFAPPTSDLTNKEALRTAFKQETIELRLYYDLALKQRGRSTFGVSRLDIQTIVCFVGAFLDGIPQNPRQDLPLALTLNFAVDDLRAYYYEAATCRAGQTLSESTIFDNWFWQETAAAKVLFAVKQSCLRYDDKMLQLVGRLLLIPAAQSHHQDQTIRIADLT
jgi:hypothetical protein